MPLSNVLGAQSIIRAGVCTSSTRPASPFEGQLIYETDTDLVLAYNGSSWVSVGASAGGLVLISTTTIGSAVSSVTVTGAFSATYDNYQIVVSGGTLSTTAAIYLKMGATATGYYYGSHRVTYANAETFDGAGNQTSFAFAGIGSTNAIMMNQCVMSPYLTTRTVFGGFYTHTQTGGNAGYSSGFLNDATSYTDFEIGVGGATMTGGEIRVYGYKN